MPKTSHVQRDRAAKAAWSVINGLDFGRQSKKMRQTLGWSAEKIRYIERQYRNLLFVWWKHPNKDLPPSEDIDEFWHNHILDTEKYFADCQALFGHYRHHYPYFGRRGAADRANLGRSFSRTQTLYKREFGEFIYVFDGADRGT